jgi:hypothetical protein
MRLGGHMCGLPRIASVLLACGLAVACWWLTAAAPAEPPLAAMGSRGGATARSTARAVTVPAVPSTSPVRSGVGDGVLVEAPAPAVGAAVAVEAEEQAAPRVRFEVVDGEGGAIANATVTLSLGERDLARGTTDREGAVRVRVPASPCAWCVTAPERWPMTGTLAGDAATVRVVVGAAPWLRGRVFDAAGRAVAGARAMLLPVVANRVGPPCGTAGDAPRARTDRDGVFALAWPDAAPRDLVVTARGHAPVVLAALAVATAPGDVVVTLPPAAAIRGVVHGENGAPLAGARVDVWLPEARPLPPRLAQLGPSGRIDGQLLAAATTALDGTFAFGDLPAANVVVALANGDGDAVARVATVPGAVIEVALAAAPLATLRCRVDGEHAAGAMVFVHGGAALARTAPAAAATFAGVPPGRYLVGTALAPFDEHVHAVMQQYLVYGAVAGALLADVGPGEDRTLALPAPIAVFGSVRGRVLAPGASTGLVVALEPSAGVEHAGALRREAAAASDGSFELTAVLPGDYDARVRQRGAAAIVAAAPCRVRAGTVTELLLNAP